MMAEYYAQRASAGLIISEGVTVSPMAVGYRFVPGGWTEEQTEGWSLITRAVHEAGGHIFMQLWHVGRISDPTYLDGRLPVAPSAIAAEGFVRHVRPKRPYVVPRALETEEVAGVVEEFRHCAENAQRAGFDGVELHGANGYLIEQFLRDAANRRDDRYGGSIENRARLLLEATDAAISVWGADRVGVHIAPRHDQSTVGDADLPGLYGHIADELGRRRIAFLCAREHEGPDSLGPDLRQRFGGPYIANERFTRDSAERIVQAGDADAVAFGKAFIANPDLVERFRRDAPLNPLDEATIYTEGPAGYIDYPALDVGLMPAER
jgi:2,4-dienoyl-CoA reductase-like NADH-dependent reductase (Old Yellow Enzyme family)